MDIQKEREAFEKYCFEVFLMSPTDGHFDRELQNPDFYESVDTHRLWNLWQAKAQAVPDGFVLVEKTDLECAIDALKWASNEDGDLCAKQACVLEDVLKAQEQANV